jgi:hypothetical protein
MKIFMEKLMKLEKCNVKSSSGKLDYLKENKQYEDKFYRMI